MKRMTGNEIRAHLRNPGVLVCFACRKGCLDRMPTARLDSRYPSKKGPLMRGMVEAVTRDGSRAKVTNGAGDYGWVDIDAILIRVDVL